MESFDESIFMGESVFLDFLGQPYSTASLFIKPKLRQPILYSYNLGSYIEFIP